VIASPDLTDTSVAGAGSHSEDNSFLVTTEPDDNGISSGTYAEEQIGTTIARIRGHHHPALEQRDGGCALRIRPVRTARASVTSCLRREQRRGVHEHPVVLDKALLHT
jgi:hypothetical protein